MSPYLTVAIIFGAILLVLMWFVSKLGNKTKYIANRSADPNASNPAELRETARKNLIKRMTVIFTVWLVLCLISFAGVAMMPGLQKISDSLHPTATYTVTNTPTITPTRTASPTPRDTFTPRPTGTPGTPTNTSTLTLPPATPTAKIVYQQVTVIVLRTVVVYQTRVVIQTVPVYQTVEVTPTFTPFITDTVSPTPTFTETFTPSPTLTPSWTPTETATP